MPTKEDIVVVQEAATAEQKPFFASDVENLVGLIKQNLRLKSKSCHAYCTKQRRTSPYNVPQRICRQRLEAPQDCHCANSKTKQKIDDPYELLQELLKEGSLIKEAVKRLELGLQTPAKTGIDYYDCSECDLPVTGSPRTLEL